MSQIFISYRREDSPEAAGRIYDRLKLHFGEKQVFFDIDSIPPGIDFRKHIRESVSKCDVLVVIIGEGWSAKDSNGISRLEDTSDFVRIEIETALKRGIPVIPVPVGKAKEPSMEELPSSIKELHYRNAYEVRSGTSFEGHIQRLINGIENSVKNASSTHKPEEIKVKEERRGLKQRLTGWKALLIIALTATTIFVVWHLNQNQLKEFHISTTALPSSVKVGEKATLHVTVKGLNGMVIEGATVLISGGGKFLESDTVTYDPSSRLQGTLSISGKTKANGVFTAWWACNPCAKGYGMIVTVSKKGYSTKRGTIRTKID